MSIFAAILTLLCIVLSGVIFFLKQRHDQTLYDLKKSHRQALTELESDHGARIQRIERAHTKAGQQSHLKLAEDLIPGLDALIQADQVAQHKNTQCPEELQKGLTLVIKSFDQALHKHDITRITPERGESFDPNIHEGVMLTEDDELNKNDISQSLRHGWQHSSRILRPAMVEVVKASSSTSSSDKDPQREDNKDEESEDVVFDDFGDDDEQEDEDVETQKEEAQVNA